MTLNSLLISQHQRRQLIVVANFPKQTNTNDDFGVVANMMEGKLLKGPSSQNICNVISIFYYLFLCRVASLLAYYENSTGSGMWGGVALLVRTQFTPSKKWVLFSSCGPLLYVIRLCGSLTKLKSLYEPELHWVSARSAITPGLIAEFF